MPSVASRTRGFGGESAAAWDVHMAATRRAARGEDILILSVGDPDFDTPDGIVRTAVDALRGGRTHYSETTGEPALRQAIADRHRGTTGQEVTADNVVVLSGAQCGLFSTAMCVLEPGDEVITLEPLYTTYPALIGATGARMVAVPQDPDGGFRPEIGAIAEAVTERTRAIMINTPHNPTGVVFTREEVEAIAGLCRDRDLWLISDEVYGTLTFDRPHFAPAQLPDMADRVVTVSSLSKTYAMTGWRLGWVIAPQPLAAHIGNLALCMLYGCPPFVQDAALHALTNDLPELDAMRDELRRRRDLVYDRLAAVPGIACMKPEGSMFMLIDIRRTGLTSLDFATGLLDAENVSVLPCTAFGAVAEGYVRLSLSVAPERLAEACDRLARFVAACGTDGREAAVGA